MSVRVCGKQNFQAAGISFQKKLSKRSIALNPRLTGMACIYNEENKTIKKDHVLKCILEE